MCVLIVFQGLDLPSAIKFQFHQWYLAVYVRVHQRNRTSRECVCVHACIQKEEETKKLTHAIVGARNSSKS